jgi:isocitrate dehydrogenase
MQTITLRYNTQNALIKSILDVAIQAGAELVKPKKQTVTLVENDDILKLYQKMFGKRKDNKYTENEVFLFNSKLNASKSFAKYL